jgi:hypothetical protein
LSRCNAVATRWNVARDNRRAHYVTLRDAMDYNQWVPPPRTLFSLCGQWFRPAGEWLVTRDIGVVPLCARCRKLLKVASS